MVSAKGTVRSFFRQLWAFRSTLILILTPIVLLPIPLTADPSVAREMKCAYVLVWMAIYWTTEVIPLPVTSLLPVILMPPLGVLHSKVVCKEYLQDTNMMFIGGLIMAVAIEKWNLHKRIALRVLLWVGAEPRWIMMGVMIPTWFLSMWISNTAATAMMVPIVSAVLKQIQTKSDTIHKASKARLLPEEDDDMEMKVITGDENDNETERVISQISDHPEYPDHITEDGTEVDFKGPKDKKHPQFFLDADNDNFDEERNADEDKLRKKEEKKQSDVAKALNLCICYSATVGGITTLTGTAPNLILKSVVDRRFAEKGLDSPVSFSKWMMFGAPVSIICLVLAWLWLVFFFIGFRGCFTADKERNAVVKKVIKREYDKLGSITFAEIMLICHFIVLALLWLTRAPGFVAGWSHLFPKGQLTGWYTTDATAAIFVGFMLFAMPAYCPNFMCLRKKSDTRDSGPSEPLLEWQYLSTHFPWSVVMLLGGGFALAKASRDSGLSKLVSDVLVDLVGGLPGVLMTALLAALVAAFTEVTSNTATATLLMGVLADIAEQLDKNPLYFMIPAVLACSFAFMLPVATPPNAVVFSYGYVKVIDMMKVGLGMNIICVLVVTFAVNTFGIPMFDLNTLPWPVNKTVATNASALLNITSDVTTASANLTFL